MRILKEKKLKHKRQGRLIIGIAGTHKGAGATHLGLMLTSCISEGIGLNTAFLNWTDSKDICFLRNYFFTGGENTPGEEHFTVSKASFYQMAGKERMAEIAARGYECIIMDFGSNFKENKEEFLRCDIKIVVGSLIPWKRYLLEEFVAETERITGSADWIYGINHALAKETAEAAGKLKRKLLLIPYGRDPFFLSPDAMIFTNTIL